MKYLLSFGHPSWLVALLFFLSGMLFYQFITGLYFVRMGRVTPKRIIIPSIVTLGLSVASFVAGYLILA